MTDLHQYIKDHWKKQTVEDIAKATKCTVAKVSEVCERLGIDPISIKDQRTAFILEHMDNQSNYWMARQLNCSTATIYDIKRKILETRAVTIPPKEKEPFKIDFKMRDLFESELKDEVNYLAKQIRKQPTTK